MSQYKPYPAYKDSGVEWLGRVPEHWDLVPLKYLVPSLTVGIVVNPSDYVADEGLPFLYGGDIGEGTISIETARCISPENSRQNAKTMLKAGDLVTVRVGAPGVTAVVPPECEGGNCASVMLIRRGEFQSDWLCYVMNSRVVRYQVEVVQYGAAQEQFNISHAVDFLIPVPPRDEQELIFGHLLSRETARIDALIEKKTRFIELLREKRQALITHAVTKGLDPNVKMKDSGVEWLGKVPEHWELKPLKLLVKQGTTISYGIVQPGEALDDGIPFVQTTNMSSGDFDINSLQKTTKEIAASFPRTCLSGGEVILGIRASIGAAFVVPPHLAGANLSRGVARIDTSQELSSSFLVAYLSSSAVDSYWQLAKQGSTFNEVSIATVKELPIPVPPCEEQVDIESVLNVSTGRFDALLSKTEHSITLLKERRSALITAAVTGQIDLREAV